MRNRRVRCNTKVSPLQAWLSYYTPQQPGHAPRIQTQRARGPT
jgi:hypothetical protein